MRRLPLNNISLPKRHNRILPRCRLCGLNEIMNSPRVRSTMGIGCPLIADYRSPNAALRHLGVFSVRGYSSPGFLVIPSPKFTAKGFRERRQMVNFGGPITTRSTKSRTHPTLPPYPLPLSQEIDNPTNSSCHPVSCPRFSTELKKLPSPATKSVPILRGQAGRLDGPRDFTLLPPGTPPAAV